jgi:Carboxypeptidase regulatory-like domain
MIRCLPGRGLGLLAAGLLVLPLLNAQQSRGRKYKPPPPTCKISVTVVKATDGKPVEDAAVVFHPINKDGKDEGNLELKTNEDGKAVINVIPVGDTVRVQVVASGYQTYGDSFPLPDDTKDITIKLNRPSHQYSIYEKHPDQSGSGQSGSGQSGGQSSGSQPQGSQPQQDQGSQKPQR